MLIYVETRVPGAGGEGRLLVPLGVHLQYKTGPRVPGCRQGSLRRWDCLGGLVVEGVKGVCLCSCCPRWSLRCRFSLATWSGTRFCE